MPNWCTNRLRVKGSPKDIKVFDNDFHGHTAKWKDSKKAGQSTRCFNALYPVPDEVLEIGYSPGPNERLKSIPSRKCSVNGYTWCINNWGTKWDIDGDIEIDDSNDEDVWYSFDTAWSPPIELLGNISTKYPELEFSLYFFEPGMAFAGVVHWKDKHTTREEYRWDSNNMWDMMYDVFGFTREDWCGNEENESDE